MDEIVALRVANLTDTQRRMLRLAAGGATTTEIAHRLDLPPRAVHQQLTSLLGTLGVRTTHEAAIIWWGSRAGAAAAVAAAAQELVA